MWSLTAVKPLVSAGAGGDVGLGEDSVGAEFELFGREARGFLKVLRDAARAPFSL